jgi:hypothetical protein
MRSRNQRPKPLRSPEPPPKTASFNLMACNQLSCLTSAAVRVPAVSGSVSVFSLKPHSVYGWPRYRNVPARNTSSALALLGVLCTTCQRGRHSPHFCSERAAGAAETDNKARNEDTSRLGTVPSHSRGFCRCILRTSPLSIPKSQWSRCAPAGARSVRIMRHKPLVAHSELVRYHRHSSIRSWSEAQRLTWSRHCLLAKRHGTAACYHTLVL